MVDNHERYNGGLIMKIRHLCKSNKIELFHKGVRDNSDIDVMKCKECGSL